VIGSIATHDRLCRRLARSGQTKIVSVDYRLAPESPFPAAVDDAHAAFAWTIAHARELEADPRRVAVGGDSMGGNLAAQVCLRARDRGERAPVFQLLLYPVVDFAARTRSSRSFAEGPLLTARLREWFHRQYLGGIDAADPAVSPLRQGDLSRLPSTFIATLACDPLRDEGQAYADRLQRAGVDVRSHCYAGLAHGCFNMTGAVTAAREALEDVARELRRAFART
jgi:acetyl esterase